MSSAPIVALDQFPIVATDIGANEAPHERMEAVPRAVAKALGLPAGIRLHRRMSGASMCAVSDGGDEVEYRARVNGFMFGTGSKKANEYLSVSWVGLASDKTIVSWSEDLKAFEATPAYWKAVNAGKPPPKPKAPKLSDSARFTFVDDKDEPTAITETLRALVAKLAPHAK